MLITFDDFNIHEDDPFHTPAFYLFNFFHLQPPFPLAHVSHPYSKSHSRAFKKTQLLLNPVIQPHSLTAYKQQLTIMIESTILRGTHLKKYFGREEVKFHLYVACLSI